MATDPQKQEEVQKIILALLLTLKDGCTVDSLNRDFYESEGRHIPWKDFGYVSLLDYLQNMPKCVHVERHGNNWYVKGIASDKSKHVNSLVQRQRCQSKRHVGAPRTFRPSHYYPPTIKPKVYIPANILAYIIGLVNEYPNGLSKDYIFSIVQTQMPHVHVSIQDMVEQLQALSHEIYIEDNKVFPRKLLTVNKSVNNPPDTKKNESLAIAEESAPLFCAAGYEKPDTYSQLNDESGFIFQPAGYIQRDLSTNKINSTIKPTSNFIQETLTKCNIQKDCESIRDRCIGCDDKMNFMDNTNVMEDTECDECFELEDVNVVINDRLKFRLEKLIEKYPEGIWCAHLPEIYLEEYKVSLNYTELGFNSIRQFASNLPEIFHCVQFNPTEDFILYNAKTQIPLRDKKEKSNTATLASIHNIYVLEDQVEALPTVLSQDTCKKLIPEGVITMGESVGYINVNDLYDRDQYIEVFVVEVFTPSLFWIQLREKRKSFNNLMEQLNTFYIQKSAQYKIPTVVLEKGLNCACLYNDIWHRGIIKTVKPDLQVTVMFYDYGTLKTYPADAIHYLHRTFSYLPAQAIPCGLINTIPCSGNKWSQGVTHEFATRTAQIPLAAMIGSVNQEDNSMLVTLTDTTEEEDVHINDWLIDQNLAKHGKMGDAVDMSNLMLYVEENLLYSPERCYANDDTIANTPKNSCDTTAEELSNVPLISPQSVLNSLPLKPPPGIVLPDDTLVLFNTLTENKHQLANTCKGDEASISIENNSSTNPFVQDKPMYSQVNPLTSELFMRLWSQNLLLQMQITAAFNDILTKVVSQVSPKNEDSHSNKQQYNPISNAFRDMNIRNDNEEDKSIANLDSPLLHNAKEDFRSISHNVKNKVGASTVLTPSSENVTHSKNLSIHTSTVLYDNDNQHNAEDSFKFRIPDKSSRNNSIGNTNSTFHMSGVSSEEKNVNSSFHSNPFRAMRESFKHKSEMTVDKETCIRERSHSNLAQPTLVNNIIDNPECSNNLMKENENVTELGENSAKHKITCKETNPFKRMLRGQIDILDDNNENHTPDSVNLNLNIKKSSAEDLHVESEGGLVINIFKDSANYSTPMEKSTSATIVPNDRYRIRNTLEKNEEHKFPMNCKDEIDNLKDFSKGIYKVNPPLCISEEDEKNENIMKQNKIDIKIKDFYSSLNTNGNENRQTDTLTCQGNHLTENDCCNIYSRSIIESAFHSNSCDNAQQMEESITMQPNLSFAPYSRVKVNRNHSTEEFASNSFDKQEPSVVKRVHDTVNQSTFLEKRDLWDFTNYCSELKNNSNACNFDRVCSASGAWSPFNVPLFYVAKDNPSIEDEGYLTRPSTSHTANSLSPTTCSIRETSCKEQLLFNNRSKSDKLYTYTWIKPVENTINFRPINEKEISLLNVKPCLSLAEKESPAFMTYNDPSNQVTTSYKQLVEPCTITSTMKNCSLYLGSPQSRASTRTEDQLENIWKMSEWEKRMFDDPEAISWNLQRPHDNLFIFQAVELSARSMYIFYYQGQGWLCIDEFVEIFTEFKTSLYIMKLLDTFCADIPIKVIKRFEYPLEFFHLDRLLWDVPRDAQNKINQINVIPLQSVMEILYNLKLITRDEVQCFSIEVQNKRDRIMYDVSVLMKAYEKLIKRIENRQNYMTSM